MTPNRTSLPSSGWSFSGRRFIESGSIRRGESVMSGKPAIIPVAIGSLILAVTAAFHFTGFADISAWVAATGDAGFFAQAIPTIWLFPTVHWLIIAIGLVAGAWFAMAGLRLLLFACALLIAIDAVLIVYAVGPFIGSAMLLAAALCYAFAATRLKPAA